MAAQHSPQSNLAVQSDLEWLAFQYAAGELHGAELDAFEQRLMNDLSACEALAAAVLLCQTVVACERQPQALPVRSKVRPRRQIVAWPVLALLSSAACLAVMVNWIEVGRPGPRAAHASQWTAGLVTLWIDGAGQAESHLETNGSTESASEPSMEVAAVNNDTDSSLVNEMDVPDAINSDDLKMAQLEPDDDADAVPGWMLAAVAERQQERGDMESEVIHDDDAGKESKL